MKKRKKASKKNKNSIFRTALIRITPWTLMVAGCAWALYQINDDLSIGNYDDLNKFLNNDKVIEQQDNTYEDNDEIEEVVFEDDAAELKEYNQKTKKTIPSGICRRRKL